MKGMQLDTLTRRKEGIVGKLTAGILLLLAGLASIIIVEIPIIWTGGLIVGAILIVGGLMEISENNKVKQELAQISQKWDDLLDRLRDDQPIDKIAEAYYQSDNIPPIRTIQVSSYLVKKLAESTDELSQALAVHLASKQIVDSEVEPKDAINQFSFLDQVYFIDDTATLYCEEPTTKDGVEGTLILNKGFLFFFEKKDSLLDHPAADHALDKLEDAFPVLSIATSGYALVSGLSNELVEYFNELRKKALKRRFELDNSMAIKLTEINQIGASERAGVTIVKTHLEVSGKSDNEEWTYWFETSRTGEKEWVESWIERLQLACIAEGKLLA